MSDQKIVAIHYSLLIRVFEHDGLSVRRRYSMHVLCRCARLHKIAETIRQNWQTKKLGTKKSSSRYAGQRILIRRYLLTKDLRLVRLRPLCLLRFESLSCFEFRVSDLQRSCGASGVMRAEENLPKIALSGNEYHAIRVVLYHFFDKGALVMPLALENRCPVVIEAFSLLPEASGRRHKECLCLM
jgi:hypothetical protein